MNSLTAEKPTISELHANAAVHFAGQDAEQDALRHGISQVEADTLLDAATGFTIKGVTFPPIHPAYLLMLGKIDKLAEQEPLLNTCGGKLVSAFLVGQPKRARQLVQSGDAAAFAEAVQEFMEPFDIADTLRIDAWLRGEFTRLNGAGDEAGKKPPAA